MSDLWEGALIDAAIWHGRSGDITRQFRYTATYLALPLAPFEANALPIRPDGRGTWRVRPRDYGALDGSPLSGFAQRAFGPALAHCEMALVTLPRSLGYGFNPVSFWLARDSEGLRAVLAEVSNTFGERHRYLCRHADGRPIAPGDRLSGEKLFHVSPFLPREGRYQFRFDVRDGRFGAWIDWIGADGEARLGTSMTGRARPLTRASLRRAAWRQPFAAQRAIALIHWQAVQLKARGALYRRKPEQLACRDSAATRQARTEDDV